MTADPALRPEDSAGLLLWRSTLRWQRVMQEALRPFGLTHVQFVVLTSVWWLDRQAGRTVNQRDVAEHAAIDPMMTSQVVRTLAARGLLRRRRDADDARAYLLEVSDPGADLAQRAVRVVEEADAGYFAAVPDHAALLAALRALGG